MVRMRSGKNVTKNDEFVLKTRSCVSKTRNFVLKMMNFAGAAKTPSLCPKLLL